MNELGLAKLRGVVRRRKLPILGTMAGALLVSSAFLIGIRPQYKASAVIRALESQPAKEYVAPTVIEQLGERLKSLRLGVMSRPIVTRAATELDLPRGRHESLDELVEDMRSRMDVKLEGEDTFLLTYSDANPERAKAVVNRVAELFMKDQASKREEIASSTVDALRNEVDELQPQLDSADKAVRDFKLKHYGALPEQIEGNLRTLDQTTMELNIQSTNVDLDQERRRQILAAALSPLRHHEEVLSQQYYDTRTRYTEDHPETLRVRAELDRLHEQRVLDEKDLYAKARRNNPELIALDHEIGRAQSIVSGLRTRQSEVRSRVDETAKNGQELASLMITYEGLRDKVSSTRGRLRDSELAVQIERSLSSHRFDLVEAAVAPSHAASPNRPLMAGGALILSLLLGLGIGFALDLQDTSVRDPGQLVDCAGGIPVLTAIPRFELKSSRPKAEA